MLLLSITASHHEVSEVALLPVWQTESECSVVEVDNGVGYSIKRREEKKKREKFVLSKYVYRAFLIEHSAEPRLFLLLDLQFSRAYGTRLRYGLLGSFSSSSAEGMVFLTRQGEPTATEKGGMSFVTIEPAPMVEP